MGQNEELMFPERRPNVVETDSLVLYGGTGELGRLKLIDKPYRIQKIGRVQLELTRSC